MTDKLLPCKHCEGPTIVDPFGRHDGKRIHLYGCIASLRCIDYTPGARHARLETVAEIDE